jgi:hypothetical protein
MLGKLGRSAAKIAASGVRHYGNRHEDPDPVGDLAALTFSSLFAVHVMGMGVSKAIDIVGNTSLKDWCPFAKPPIDGDGGDV